MERTINEIKASRGITISTILMAIFSFATLISIKYRIFLLAYYGLFLAIGYFGYSAYSLGWEYKRISLQSQNPPKMNNGKM